MAGMYGLGYGAGAAGAGLGQGMVQGMMLQPQLQAQGLQNQQRQMSVDEQKAMQQEYALAPQVLADPSIKNPDGSFNSAALFSRLPRLGPPLLQSAAGAGLTTAHANMYGVQAQNLEQKSDMAKQAALNNLQARVGVAVGNETDPAKRMQILNTFTPEFQQLSGGKDPQWDSIVTNSPAYFQALAKGNTDPNKNLHNDAMMEDLKYKAAQQTERDKAKFAFLKSMEGMKTRDKGQLQSNMIEAQKNLAQFHINNPSNADMYYLDHAVRSGVDPRDAYIDLQGIKSQAQGKDPASRAEATVAGLDKTNMSMTGKPLPQDRRDLLKSQYVSEYSGLTPPPAPKKTQPQQPATNPAAAQHSIKEYQVGQTITDSSGKPAKDGTYNLADGTIVVNGGKALFITPKGK